MNGNRTYLGRDKETYERRIEESSIFFIDKDGSPSLYGREKYRFVENVYCYLMTVNEQKYEPYACEILEVIESCLKSFDPSKGNFLHYFNVAWKRRQKRVAIDNYYESQYRGMKLKESDMRALKKIRKYMNEIETDGGLPDSTVKIAEMLGISTEEVSRYMEMQETVVLDESVWNSGEKECNLVEQIADSCCTEDEIIDREQVTRILDSIQATYDAQQNRTKPIISDYITTTLYPLIRQRGDVSSYSFLSEFAIFVFDEKGAVLTKREIALRHNRDEASVNRTIKNFIKRLSEKMEGEHDT